MWRFDDPRSSPDGVPLPGKYKDSYCIFKLPEKIESLTEAIHLVRDVMKIPGLMSEFLSSSIEKSIYCTLDGEGELLAVAELKILCELDIKLEID